MHAAYTAPPASRAHPMAKKPVKPSSGPRPAAGGPNPPAPGPEPDSTPSAPAVSGVDDMAGELMVTADELDEIERRLNAGLASAEPPVVAEPESPSRPERPVVESRPPESKPPEKMAPARKSAAAPDVEDRTGFSRPKPKRAGGSEPVPDDSEAAGPEAAEAAASPEAEAPLPVAVPKRGPAAGFGAKERLALAGFGVIGVVAAVFFFKFLYGHPAPVQGPGLPKEFNVPMASAQIRVVAAEASWRPRTEIDKARTEEVMLPSLSLTLDPAQSSKGFVRVEFQDPDGKIRGDVMTVEIDGGRFKDGGRGEVIEEGGSKVRLVGTVGFRSSPLFTSYLVSDETRWSVRIKEGPDYSNGPWTDLGAALIPNPKLSTQSNP